MKKILFEKKLTIMRKEGEENGKDQNNVALRNVLAK